MKKIIILGLVILISINVHSQESIKRFKYGTIQTIEGEKISGYIKNTGRQEKSESIIFCKRSIKPG